MAQNILNPQAIGNLWIGRSVILEEGNVPDTRTEYIKSQLAELTKREREVLQLVAVGFSNAEITDRLRITSATIVSYLNSIYGKLGVRSRTAAMRFAIDHHLCLLSPKQASRIAESTTANTCTTLNTSVRAKLTRREMEVLLLVTAGHSNADIADRLVVTLATVFGYLNVIYKKLGVRSRTAAMRYAIDHSLC